MSSIPVTFGEDPTEPCPDPTKPYIWLGKAAGWKLLASDTADGVPEKLDDLTPDKTPPSK